MPIDWGDAPTWVQAAGVAFVAATFYQEQRKQRREREKEAAAAEEERTRTARLVTVTFISPSDTGTVRPARVEITNASTEEIYRVRVLLRATPPGEEPIEITGSLASVPGRVADSPWANHENIFVDVPPRPGLDGSVTWDYEWSLEFVDSRGRGWRKTSAGHLTSYELAPDAFEENANSARS